MSKENLVRVLVAPDSNDRRAAKPLARRAEEAMPAWGRLSVPISPRPAAAASALSTRDSFGSGKYRWVERVDERGGAGVRKDLLQEEAIHEAQTGSGAQGHA